MIPERKQAVYLARGLNPEPLHVETENSRFAHDCAFHWLHRQGNTFIVNASLLFYSENRRFKFSHTYDMNDMKILAVVTLLSIYHGCSTWKTFW